MKIRPSSLPMLQRCAAFESSSEDSEFASAGTARHKYLSYLFESANCSLDEKDLLTDDDISACEWAAEYIRTHAPMSDHPIDFERRLSLINLDTFEEIFSGTPDVVCGADLFDLKWRRRDYSAQMAAYALMMFENNPGLDKVRVHVLYGESQFAERFELTPESARKIVFSIIEKTDLEPRPNEYCGWCSKRLACPAYTGRVNEVVSGREDWKLENYHTSQIESPEQMGKALTVARLLKKWCEAVEYHAEKMAIEKNCAIPGFVVKERKGKINCTDASQAFSLAGIPQDDFMKCCALRMNTSKDYPDRVGLIDLVQKKTGANKAAAKRDLLARLSPVLTTGKSTKYLAASTGALMDGKQNQITE